MVDPTLALEALDGAKKSGDGWWRANCPYCMELTGKEDKRASLGIKPGIAFFTCFKCGARGRLPDDDVLTSFKAIVEPKAEGEVTFEAPPGFEALGDDDAWTSTFLEEPREYMGKRGISRATIISAGIGAVVFGKLAGRIVVPCFDLDGDTWLGYSARDWTGKQDPKYKYPYGMQRQRFLYNQGALYKDTDEPVMIVEGVFDALPYWPNAVACLGKPGETHRKLLADEAITRPIAVCLDGDAHEEGWSLSEILKLNGRRSGFVHLPPCTDPCSVDREWLKQEARQCTKY
jgi:DNA primase